MDTAVAPAPLSITTAFARARAFLSSPNATAMHVVSVTYDTAECGLVAFTMDAAGNVSGIEVADDD